MTDCFDGYLYPQGSSHRTPVRVCVDETGLCEVKGDSGRVILVEEWGEVEVSPRVGNAQRRLEFSAGEVIETSDNDIVDAIVRSLQGTTVDTLVHRMERLTLFTLVVLLVTGAIAFSFFKWWLPAASDRTAMILPPGLLDEIGEQTLAIMDRGFLGPSEIDEARKQHFRSEFDRLLEASGSLNQAPELLFRSARRMGPNAFALPNGQVVITDELIELSTIDLQVTGVLAHEISHVEERHIMRSFLRSTSVAVIIVMITGDMAELTELAIAVPAFMVEMGYSRDFEREADERAYELMGLIGEDPNHLADMFALMAEHCGETCSSTWISSHPDIKEHIASIRGRSS